MPIIYNFPFGDNSGTGIPLGSVTNINTLSASNCIYIKWTDPEDIITDDTSAEWQGTLLVRKAGSMPTNRRDGTVVLDSIVRNQYSETYFCDSGLSNGQTYYYKFFPYTVKGAYTNHENCEFFATPTAQVNGIEQWIVTDMFASNEAGDGKININWSDPPLTIVDDGVTLATWSSTTIVLKENSYATSKDDSEAIYTLKVTTRNQYVTSPLTVTGLTNGTTYYISFFPETEGGGINTSVLQHCTGVANRITISDVPSQNGTLTYNQTTQSPNWDNYNSEQLILGGTVSGINAGTYDAIFAPKDDYRWADGTTTAKIVSWTIEKATGTLTVSKSTITLNQTMLSDIFTIGGNHDGTVSVISNDTSIVTVSTSGNTVTVNNVNKTSGITTITVSCTAGTNYTAPSSKSVSVEAKFVSSVLNENDWSVIKSISDNGEGANYWEIGDCKAVIISGTVGTQTIQDTYYVYIIGFNHNSSREGTGITFGTFKTALSGGEDICLIDSHYGDTSTSGEKWFNMNHSANTNSGGWKGCDLRYDVLGSTDINNGNATTTTATSPVSGTLMAAFPSDLRAVMKPMTIYTDNTGGGSNTASHITETVDYLPLLAEFEIFGEWSNANSAEQNYQKQYQYYINGNPTRKSDQYSENAHWCNRSPSGTVGFTSVRNRDGSPSSTSARTSIGLSPIFRV